jgi:hypothetical protein
MAARLVVDIVGAVLTRAGQPRGNLSVNVGVSCWGADEFHLGSPVAVSLTIQRGNLG